MKKAILPATADRVHLRVKQAVQALIEVESHLKTRHHAGYDWTHATDAMDYVRKLLDGAESDMKGHPEPEPEPEPVQAGFHKKK